jgi:hypothetical protein
MQTGNQTTGPWLPLHELVESLLSELDKEREMLPANHDQEKVHPALPAAS